MLEGGRITVIAAPLPGLLMNTVQSLYAWGHRDTGEEVLQLWNPDLKSYLINCISGERQKHNFLHNLRFTGFGKDHLSLSLSTISCSALLFGRKNLCLSQGPVQLSSDSRDRWWLKLGKARSVGSTQKIPTLSLLCSLCSCRCPNSSPGYLQNSHAA